jgi:hypothetical protein
MNQGGEGSHVAIYHSCNVRCNKKTKNYKTRQLVRQRAPKHSGLVQPSSRPRLSNRMVKSDIWRADKDEAPRYMYSTVYLPAQCKRQQNHICDTRLLLRYLCQPCSPLQPRPRTNLSNPKTLRIAIDTLPSFLKRPLDLRSLPNQPQSPSPKAPAPFPWRRSRIYIHSARCVRCPGRTRSARARGR